MIFLYLLSEDDNDDLFYEECVSKIIGRSVKVLGRRLRKGGGITSVRRAIKYILRSINNSGPVEDTFFAIALDNDRSLHHPNHENPLKESRAKALPNFEREKACRHCQLVKAIEDELGPRETWPIQGAVAVPREMLESWLLLICNPDKYEHEAKLPLFAEKSKSLAKKYYNSKAPPEQLKDLRALEKSRIGISDSFDFCFHCCDQLEPERLAELSPSFALFKAQVDRWACPTDH